jgi:hypothetical protein
MRGPGYGSILVAGMVALLAGCSASDTGSVAEQACERLDTCNALNVGESVDDCTASTESDLGKLSAAQRADVEKLLGDCLEFQTCSAYLNCLDPDGSSAPPPTDDPPPQPPPPETGHAQFAFSWAITLDGQPSTCATVGADRVTLEVTGAGRSFREIYDCADLRGVTSVFPLGTYSIVMTIDQGMQELGRSDPFSGTLDRNQGLVDLGGITWQFTSN